MRRCGVSWFAARRIPSCGRCETLVEKRRREARQHERGEQNFASYKYIHRSCKYRAYGQHACKTRAAKLFKVISPGMDQPQLQLQGSSDVHLSRQQTRTSISNHEITIHNDTPCNTHNAWSGFEAASPGSIRKYNLHQHCGKSD